MIWVDNTFPYGKYKGIKFEAIAVDSFEEEDKNIQYVVDYCKELGMYRVTQFKNNHWNGDLVFREASH